MLKGTFHFLELKCCPKIVKLLEKLKPKPSELETEPTCTSDLKAYHHLALLSFICITNFGGYPQLYKPVLDIIQVYIYSEIDVLFRYLTLKSLNSFIKLNRLTSF